MFRKRAEAGAYGPRKMWSVLCCLLIWVVGTCLPCGNVVHADALNSSTSHSSTINSSAYSATAKLHHNRQAILVLVDRLGNEDLAHMPHLQDLARMGAIGLMNSNTGGRRTDANAYATLAAGAPARMQDTALLAYDAAEQVQTVTAGQIYGSLHGRSKDHGVVVLSMPKLLRDQSQREYANQPGAIGDALHGAGLRTAVFGSDDLGAHLWRPGVLMSTDSRGLIDDGDVGKHMLAFAPDRAYGVRTDYDRMWRAYTEVQNRVSLVVFELGDLYRLEMYRKQMTTERYQAVRQQILQEIDEFAECLQQALSPKRLVIFTAPRVSQADADQHEWLTPVVIGGGAVPAQTVVTSATTRRAGLVSDVDIAPTILRFLQVQPPPQMIGYSLQDTAKMAPEQVEELLHKTVWAYTHRQVVLVLVGVWIGLGLLATLLRLALCVEVPARLIRWLLWSGMSMPLCLYVLPVFHTTNLWEVWMGIGAAFLMCVAIPFRILPLCKTRDGRILWLAGSTVAVVVADIWLGGDLAQNSLLSYDPIIGARYYGVGNEYMGVVVGCVLLCFGVRRQARRIDSRFTEWGLLLGCGLLTCFFASPQLGANTGGALTMAGTTALCWARIRRCTWISTTRIVLGGIATAVALLLWLNQVQSMPSHIGLATHQVLTGGWGEMGRIWARKTEMVQRLFTESIWPTVLLAVSAVFATFLFSPLSRRSAWWQEHLDHWSVVEALVGGAVIGLLTNDSGIVVVAMMMLFAAFPALLIWLEVEQVARQEVEQFQPLERVVTKSPSSVAGESDLEHKSSPL